MCVCVCVCVCVCEKVEVLVVLSCPTLCDPMDCSPPGFSVHGILQVTVLEWVAMPSSRGSSWPKDQTQSTALQADFLPSKPPGKLKNTGVGSLSLHPSPADLPDPGIKTGSGRLFTSWDTHIYIYIHIHIHIYTILYQLRHTHIHIYTHTYTYIYV